MAKTESTAVNELISLVQNRQQPQAEPASDLFAAPSPAQKPGTVQPPRMTSTVPAMRGAGEVAPLPRGRAPQSTSSHQLPVPSPVRMKTASPARGTTIPPLSRPSTPPPVPARATSSQPVLPPPLPGRAQPDPLAALDSIEIAPAESNRDIDNALEAMWPEPKTTSSSPTLASPRVTRPSLPPPKPSLPTLPAPRLTAPSLPPPRVTPRATLPPAFTPVAAPFEAKPATDENPFAAKPLAVADHPFAAVPSQYPVVKRTPSVDLTADVVKAENWFDVSSKVAKVEETWVGSRTKSGKSIAELARMLVVPAIVAASVGVAIGVYISYRQPPKQTPHASTAPAIQAPSPLPAAAQQPEREVTLPVAPPDQESANAATASAGGGQPQPPTKAEDAAAQRAAEAAAAANPNDPAAEPTLTHDAPVAAVAKTAPEVTEIQTPKAVVKLVDVRIDSKPSGATVTLVDNGKPSFLGTTPLATSLDPAHGYDVIFTLEGRPTQMAHFDPAKESKLEVSLGHTHHHASPTTAAVEAPKTETKAAAPKTEAKAAAPRVEAKAAKTDAPKADAKAAAKKLAEPSFDTAGDAGGQGTLMVSSKPPCEIYIDGKATGLTTPQRSIPLAAGAHKITFVNATDNIKKTVSVKITADQSTKLIQDLMAH